MTSLSQLRAACSVCVCLWLIAASGASAIEVPEEAFGTGALDRGEPRVASRLLVDAAAVAPGDAVRVGVLFSMDPEWHIYWRNPGQAAYATEVIWSGDASNAGETRWPLPERFVGGGGYITTFGYSDTVLLMSEWVVPSDASGSLEVVATVDYLACKVDCIPGRSELRRSIEVGPATVSASAAVSEAFETFASRVPLATDQHDLDVEIVYTTTPIRPGDEGEAVVAIVSCAGPSAPSCREIAPAGEVGDTFFPDRITQLALTPERVREHPSALHGLLIDVGWTAGQDHVATDQRFTGVASLLVDGVPVAIEVDAPLPRAPRDVEVAATVSPLLSGALPESSGAAADLQEAGGPPAPTPATPFSLWHMLWMAFLGGMILNLMPCVLPVLAVKVVGFTQLVHESRGNIVAHAAAYTGGIIGSMLVLAGAVIALRSAGLAVGWGFQFQEPLFIVVVSTVVVVFAMNLFGVFEVALDANRLDRAAEHAHGVKKSIFEGVLTVVLATPCSAPLLGTAVGFALAASALNIVLIFIVLGFGLAAPFVLLTAVPGWSRFVPKPGMWMVRMRQFLGFALLGAAIWLVSILGQAFGAAAITRTVLFLLIAAVGVWFFGIVQHRSVRASRLSLALAVVVSAVLGALVLRFEPPAPASDGPTESAAGITWLTFSPAAVERELANGRVVFVDFTADWCITCKVNERQVIETPRMASVFRELDVAVFVADWTLRDDVIHAELARYGKAGVPMYLVYSPADPNNPDVLPELLTADRLEQSLRYAHSL